MRETDTKREIEKGKKTAVCRGILCVCLSLHRSSFVAMASGFGINGKKGRCYDVWMDFSDCMTHCVMPAECTALRDDYFECLHHRKEVPLSLSLSFSYTHSGFQALTISKTL